MTRLPRLLDSNLNEVKRLHPLSLSISEKLIPLSYATMYLMKDEMVSERSYVELFTPIGSAGIFRTRSPQEGIGTNSYTLDMEHAITEVGDYLVDDDIDEELQCNSAISKLFGYYRGNRWKLGRVECTDTVYLDISYDNLLESITGVLDQVIDYVMSFDFSTKPWTLNIVKKEKTVTAEGRIDRNIQSATIKKDDKDLCTRVYVMGLPSSKGGDALGYMDADTISKYGVVEYQISGKDYSEEQARRVAKTYLDNHKEPRQSVEISAIELSKITGEEFDKLRIGKMFRLAIPSHKIVIEDNISAIVWNDVINSPMSATVSLGDDRDPVIEFYQNMNSSAKGGGRSASKAVKANKEYITRFEQTDRQITLWAAHTDGNNKILEQAGITLDSDGVIQYAEDNEKNIGSMFKVQAYQISSEVTQRKEGEIALQSSITQTATQIRSEVSNSVSNLSSRITQESNRISLVVEGTGANARIKPAEIVAAINNGQSSIKISANHIQLDGNTIASYLTAIDLTVQALTIDGGDLDCGAVDCGYVDCTGIGTNGGDISCGDIDCDSMTFDGTGVSWKSKTVMTDITLTQMGATYFRTTNPSGTTDSIKYANPVTNVTKETSAIYYLGR